MQHETEQAFAVESAAEHAHAWQTVVWNDPVNLMSYVVFVFREHFGYSRPRAEKLMWQVHEEGRAIVSSGPREQVESDVLAMHRYGLRATMEQIGEAA
ncbi:ATP-dependent Clp protease adapter ClpS [Dermabacteraceae bacterium P13101]|nr:ATP-dependent Clp protease adapter ClpS [Dermabacteraceae bacterium TAE3-ERU27]